MSEGLIDFLYTQGSGNPLFTLELIDHLHSTGDVVVNENSAGLSGKSTVNTPTGSLLPS